MRLFPIALAVVSLIHLPVRAAGPPWFGASGGSSIVFSNQSQSAATRVFADLSVARAAMAQVAGVDVDVPLRAFAVNGETDLRQLLPQYWEQRGVRPHAASYAGPHAAFIAIRGDLPPRLQAPLLLHEYIHLLTDRYAPEAPAWLDEGLSEFWGSLVFEHSQIVVGRAPVSHLKLLRARAWLPMAEMLRRDRIELGSDREQVAMFYAQSWAIVHYLLLGKSSIAPTAFVPAHPERVTQFESEIRAYILEGRFHEVAVPSHEAPAAPAREFAVTEARALAERGDMLVFGERPDATLPLVRRALALEPRQPLALEVMGTYYFLRNQPEPAREWLTRSLEANPDSYRTALYLALLTPSPVERERYLMSAIRVNPSATLAWQRLWTLYEEDGRAAAARRWCQSLRRLPLLWMRVNLPPGCRS